MNEIDKRLTMIADSPTDEFFLKGTGEDGDNDDNENLVTTTINNIDLSDISIIITADNMEEIRLLINGRCSMV